MSIPNIEGYWTGEIFGTNRGGVSLDIKQAGEKLSGIAKMHEPALGQYEYSVEGSVKDGLSIKLTPGRHSGNIAMGNVQVLANLDSDTEISGRWESDIGTEGAFRISRFDEKKFVAALPKNNSVFLVHGHDEGTKQSVARFLEKLGIIPVILQEQINKGMTVLEKFEQYAARAGFAVVLMTPDDCGYPVSGTENQKRFRARQNVVLELGYFAAKLGRAKTMVLKKGEIEMPSDVFGLIYESLDNGQGWKLSLAQELKSAGFDVDLNKALT
jgi:predicted nucleotide-binding protein